MIKKIEYREIIKEIIILTIITISPAIAIILITKMDSMLEYMANETPELWAAIMAPIGIAFGVTLVITYILSLLVLSIFRRR